MCVVPVPKTCAEGFADAVFRPEPRPVNNARGEVPKWGGGKASCAAQCGSNTTGEPPMQFVMLLITDEGRFWKVLCRTHWELKAFVFKRCAKMAKQEEISIKVENALKKLGTRHHVSTEDSSVYVGDTGIKYDTKERVVKSVVPPVSRIPSDEELFDKDGVPDYRFLMKHFQREGRLREDQLVKIIEKAESILKKEPNLLYVDVPATVVGDIHGQFYDLLGMFEMCGDPSETQYIFLGDYVDRGDRSIEVLILLYAMKISHPTHVWLLRGNHESKRMTSYFTFQKECLCRYSGWLYRAATRSFRALPLCAVLNHQFFCVHAGISSSLWDLEEINEKIDRFSEDFPSKGLFCDLMWSDPSEKYDDEEIDEDDVKQYYSFNYERRCSEFYSYRAVETFLNHNDLLSVVRGHQPQDNGYRIYKVNEVTSFPSLITIFSAPNYCGTYNNMAAVLVYNGESFNIKQFDSYPAPYFLPNQMNVFEWSLPFVGEKVVEILSAVLNICTEDELNKDEISLDKENMRLIQGVDESNRDEEEAEADAGAHKRAKRVSATEDETEKEAENENTVTGGSQVLFGESIRKKMLMVGRMSRILSLLREEREKIDELKSLNHGDLPKRTLIDGREELHNKLRTFKEARDMDIANEGLPPSSAEMASRAQQRSEKYQQYVSSDDEVDAEADEAGARED